MGLVASAVGVQCNGWEGEQCDGEECRLQDVVTGVCLGTTTHSTVIVGKHLHFSGLWDPHLQNRTAAGPCSLHAGQGSIHANGLAWCMACSKHLVSVDCKGGGGGFAVE